MTVKKKKKEDRQGEADKKRRRREWDKSHAFGAGSCLGGEK